jgi:Xaa-Pro aminopeptidase
MLGLLLAGDTERSAALRHEIPVPIIDPLLFAEVDGRRYVLTTRLESERVQRELPDAEVLDYFDLGYKDFVATGMTMHEAGREVEVRALQKIGLTEAIVPAEFPLALADRLRAEGVTLTVDEQAIQLRRRSKTPVEVEGIRAAVRAAEAGLGAAAELLVRAEPGAEGRLEVDGRPLTAEHVREALRGACAEAGAPCPADVIVASVWQGNGHEPGSGPLPAGLPIHIDLWPRHEESGCWADMARTFVAGEPVTEHAEVIAKQQRLVRQALDEAKAAVRPGITGRELFDATCDLFEAEGYPTQRTSDGEESGFQHSLGHGVGLEIHEAPGLGLSGRDPLVAGDVVAIEPGLWDERAGGVCHEDLVLVTETGSEVLTQFRYELEL